MLSLTKHWLYKFTIIILFNLLGVRQSRIKIVDKKHRNGQYDVNRLRNFIVPDKSTTVYYISLAKYTC